jgi:hypothetical protein
LKLSGNHPSDLFAIMQDPQFSTPGFDGSRLRKLQLERAKSAVSSIKGDDKKDAFRRWSSMNEVTEPAAPRSLPNMSKAMREAMDSSACSLHNTLPNERVVYMLPDPKMADASIKRNKPCHYPTNNQSASFDQLQWSLKYPHGMPRWGPKSHASSVSYQQDTSDYGIPLKQDDSEMEKEKESSSRSPKKQKNLHSRAVQKARQQSELAGARAAQKIAPRCSSSSQSARKHPNKAVNKRNGGLLGARFLLGRQSLLDSARVQQAHVMQGNQLRHTISLDGDPLEEKQQHTHQQQKHNATRSVGTFEYLRHPSMSISVDSEHNRGECNEELSIDSEVDGGESNGNGCAPLYDGEEEGEEESWDLEDGSNGAAAELSIDESIQASSRATCRQDLSVSMTSSSDPSLFDTPRSSSIPTVILSEIDPENSSRYSDYSSLAMHNNDEGDEFFDAQASQHQRAPPMWTRTGHKPFDTVRCRELLALRAKYMEMEDGRRLLSHQAEERLASTPSLLHVAKESTLVELSTRSRWLMGPSTPISPFSASYPSRREALANMPDDSPSVQPIELVPLSEIGTAFLARRNDPWHVSEAVTNQESLTTHERKRRNSHNQAYRAIPFLERLRVFATRCVLVSLLLLWAECTSVLFLHHITYEAAQVGICRDGCTAGSAALSSSSAGNTAPLNSTRAPQSQRITLSAVTHMPILLVAPHRPEKKLLRTTKESNPPPKCVASVTRKEFLEMLRKPAEDVVAETKRRYSTDQSTLIFLACLLFDQTISSDTHCISCSPDSADAPSQSEAYIDGPDCGLPDESVDRGRKPRLKLWADNLRKHGEQLLNQRMHRRELYRV